MIAEIIAAGSEMLTPHRQDTNSLHLTARLNALGVSVAFKTIVGDNLEHLTKAVTIALSRADILLITGGLGPTEDDLTREAVSAALSIEIRRSPDLLTAMYKRFAQRRQTMPPNNAKQADILTGAVVLPNANGSAPGQWLDVVVSGHRKLILLLPGPPREMEPLFAAECEPRLARELPERHIAHRQLRIALVPESKVDALAAPVYKRFKDVETTILASAGEIQLHFLCAKPALADANRRVNSVASKVEDALGDNVFSSHGESLEEVVLLRLDLRHLTLAVAESITGGLLSARLTSVPGSSRVFAGGAVVYSSALKHRLAGVPDELIAKYGAVSEQVARALAEGIRRATGAGVGLALTGVAGPNPITDADGKQKPVGLVYFAASLGRETITLKKNFTGDRERVRSFATLQALDILRRLLD
jgi:nicotinamide-nucleotide amidase